MRPKSLLCKPPSLASAPMIWRGSTLLRRPTAMRYIARAGGTGSSLPSITSGESPCSTTASAAATSSSGTSYSCT